jgi:hypothetical protein
MQFNYSIKSNKRTKKKDNWVWEIAFPSGQIYSYGESYKPKKDLDKELTNICKRLDVRFGFKQASLHTKIY